MRLRKSMYAAPGFLPICVIARTRSRGFALVEVLIAASIVTLVGASTIYGLFRSNQYAASQRCVSSAKALCQERIDQALTQKFSIKSIPLIFGGSWPLPTTETQTSIESVPIYVNSDSANAALVTGTRQTWVIRYTPVATSPTFVFARVRVRVEFWNQGRGLQNKKPTDPGAQPFSYEMTTLRSTD